MSTTADERSTTVRAQARFVRTAPRKAQLVVDQIRGRSVPEARTILAFLTRAAAKDVEKVLKSAVANAEANHGLIGDDLYVAEAYVGDGPMLKRYRARARGRVARIRKRTCHITLVLATPPDYEFVELPETPPAVAETPEPESEVEETPEALADEEAEALVDEEAEAPTDEVDEETAEEEAAETEAVAETLPAAVETLHAPAEPPPEEEAPKAGTIEVEPETDAEPEAASETAAAEAAIEERDKTDATPSVDESATTVDEAETPVEEEAPKKPRRRSSTRKKATAEEKADEAEDKPAPKRRSRKKADETDEEGEEG